MGRSIADRARVTAAWTASYDPALRVARGQALAALGLDPDNPGWRWCANAEGLGGWLPDGLVVDGRATDAFDSTELTVAVGAGVLRLRHHGGWSLCRADDGREGWLPASCLSPG